MGGDLRRSRRVKTQPGALAEAAVASRRQKVQERRGQEASEQALMRTQLGRTGAKIGKLALKTDGKKELPAKKAAAEERRRQRAFEKRQEDAQKQIRKLRRERAARVRAQIGEAAELGFSKEALEAAYGSEGWRVSTHPLFISAEEKAKREAEEKARREVEALTSGLGALRPFAVGTHRPPKGTRRKASRGAPKKRKGGTRRRRR